MQLSDTTKLIITLIEAIGVTVYNVYIFSAIALAVCKIIGHERWPWANLLWYWCKWPALAYLITDPVFDILLDGELSWFSALLDAFSIWVWWSYRNHGDDDDYKKLKKKLKESVKAINGKLVVVPVRA